MSDKMPDRFLKPSDAVLAELEQVAQKAADLLDYVQKANRLPKDFPAESVKDFCRALLKLPGAPVDEAIQTLAYTRKRLPRFRPSLPVIKDGDEEIRREEELDNFIGLVDRYAGSAIAIYEDETEEDVPTPEFRESPARKTVEDDFGTGQIISEADSARQQVHQLQEKMLAEKLNDDELGQEYLRGLIASEIQLLLAKSESEQPAPKPLALKTVGNWLVTGSKKLGSWTVEGIRNIGSVAEHAEGVGSPFADAWGRIQADAIRSVLKAVAHVGTALRESAEYIQKKGKKDPDPPEEESDVPPDPPFDLDEAREMIIRGEAPPAIWRPQISNLVYFLHENSEKLTDLQPLAVLNHLEHLDIDGTGVTSLAPLANLQSLNQLDLQETQVTDLAPLANLQSLNTLDLQETQVSAAEVSKLDYLEYLTVRGGPAPREGKPRPEKD